MIRDTLKVLLPNAAVFGLVTFTQIELVLKVAMLLASLVYTLLKIAEVWRRLRTKKLPEAPEI